jgi:aldehyde dehydrogenase (NAD+)
MQQEKKINSIQKSFFNERKTSSINKRLFFLKNLQSELKKRTKDVFQALYKDLKKSNFESFTSETMLVEKELKIMIRNLKDWSKPKRVSGALINFPSKDYLISEPYGNILMISPWNYPFQLSMTPLIGAIAAGNTVVLKPSESAPHTANIIEEIISSVFPMELVKVIKGDADTAKNLLKLKWDYIFYTGSTKVGKIIAKAAAKNLTPTTLELGGKSPCIVDDTVPVKRTAKRIIWGKLINCGQTCIAPDYILVQKNIKADLIKELINEIKIAFTQEIEKSNDYGRIIHEAHFDKLIGLLKNQKILFGGDHKRKNLYISPTIIDEPKLDCDLMCEEIFGPILPIISYENEEDISKIINNLEKPLALYIFSKNNKFINKILNKFSFGGAVVNDTLIHFANANLPFGGIGQSGMGAYHGKYSFNLFSHLKPVVKRPFYFDLPQRFAPYPKSIKYLKFILSKL